jgi:site-specific DNA-methyltransferase (adenine-specific)
MKEYYLEKNFTLYNGNCIDVLKSLPAGSVDMIFADPPYFLSNGSFTCHAGKRVSVKKGDWDLGNGAQRNLEFHIQWLKACKRVLKPNSTIWVSGTYHSIYQCGVALEINGYHFLNDIAWFKPNAAPNLSCRFFTASHETLIWARKEKKGKHIFNYDLMKNGKWKEDSLKKDGTQMRSVWSISTPKPSEKLFGKHPTQKPLDLLKRIVLASTNKGDVILDPFTGSSTTGIAAVTNDRTFIGIDKEKQYLELSIKRFKNLNKHKISAAESSETNYNSVQPFLLEHKAKYVSKKKIRAERIQKNGKKNG